MSSIVALHQSHSGGAPLDRLTSARLMESAGLEGDRHSKQGSRRALLLVDQETLDLLGLAPGTLREQITVKGIALAALAPGTRLTIGAVVLEVGQACDPCELMEAIRPGLERELEGRRGRFARVLEGGPIAVGDSITLTPPA
jgi:MOSC domain-containing protein YiiM